MLFILPSLMIIYMCTFDTISHSDSESVILSNHPHENISSLTYVGMSADDVTPMLFTVSTIIFPIPAYLLKTIGKSRTMSFNTKRMHESFMKALLCTTIQPTLLFIAISITFAQNIHIFYATEFSESIITLSASFSTISNPLATLFFVKQYKNFVLRMRKISRKKSISITKKESNCNVV
ncbi:hypothetical protein PRIPAC_83006 [Pristionchus pacificus]|uniref:G protein-coupled receptor n=1 Tax=Pristionchus pacificus TaxID=54126 RepID=A0A2A6C2B2_PRIPA|nr:hypothetical protein PRIPAC_83006 [Pristionchus pacificus]|eukprot:PDM72372.1 G protein-coupled receptor [Pristionchus pacificus]